MKKLLSILLLLLIIGFFSFQIKKDLSGVKLTAYDASKSAKFHNNQTLQNGDIIFQTSKSSQSKAIQLATNSPYSHMGIVYKIKDQFMVYEAIQPVKLTPLQDWIERGQDGKYVVKRLKNADFILNQEKLNKMKAIGEQFAGKDYDLYFEWSDDKIYCSELVWKIYKEGLGIEIGQLEKLSDFDLSNKIVQDKMKERYGNEIPKDELFISPAAMFESKLLEPVK